MLKSFGDDSCSIGNQTTNQKQEAQLSQRSRATFRAVVGNFAESLEVIQNYTVE